MTMDGKKLLGLLSSPEKSAVATKYGYLTWTSFPMLKSMIHWSHWWVRPSDTTMFVFTWDAATKSFSKCSYNSPTEALFLSMDCLASSASIHFSAIRSAISFLMFFFWQTLRLHEEPLLMPKLKLIQTGNLHRSASLDELQTTLEAHCCKNPGNQVAVSIGNAEEQSITCLSEVCSHQLLQCSLTHQQEVNWCKLQLCYHFSLWVTRTFTSLKQMWK